ncbi:MAG: Asp23/Gls24 family envelope stress response protein [Atribacterota bacterium]
MELATVNTDKGNINISRMTIEILIHLVLKDIKGVVVPRKTRLSELSNKDNKSTPEKNEGMSQEIKIEIKPDSVIVNLFLIINYGIRIPDLTWEIQAKVKGKLKEIAGLDVNIINIHINGIRYPNKYQNKDKLMIPEMFVKIF